MAGTLADRLKQAFAENGLPVPQAKPKAIPKPASPTGSMQPRSLKSVGPSDNEKGGPLMKGRKSSNVKPPRPQNHKKVVKQQIAPLPDLSCYNQGSVKKPKQPATAVTTLGISRGARLSLNHTLPEEEPPLLGVMHPQGGRTQCTVGKHPNDERQIVLGLDFGTSSVKAVIGDAALGKAFAVPFRLATDIQRYLLPARLFESSGKFSLTEGEHIHRDLKLALIANPNDQLLRRRVTAFLALVICHARNWLLTEHREIYQRTRLFWKVSIGLPAAHHLDDRLHQTFSEIANLAWLTSLAQAVNIKAIADAGMRWKALCDCPEGASRDEEVDVSVVPEIAAQIYGFVKSSRFNRNAPNIYLMVDVGAGSVDSSLFHVKPSRGKWDFEFFTSVVEPLGVMNLHRHRVQWWEEQLVQHPSGERFAEQLAQVKYATDRTTGLPERYSEYFHGITVKTSGGGDPDIFFFRKKVALQVRSQTYYRAWKDGLLTQNQLDGVPTFYCGGGMRMNFYDNLRHELRSMPGCSWLKADPRRIELPDNLEAPGVKRADYDRLSVAYGLSFLEVGKITKSLPAPKLPTMPAWDWSSNYVSKDHC